MNLRQLALEEALLKILAEKVRGRLKDIREASQHSLESCEKENGTRQVAAVLPDGTIVATMSLTEPGPEAKITDQEIFTSWVVKEFPDEIHRRFVTEVRPAFVTVLLAEMTKSGAPKIVDKETGEVREVPGVEVKTESSRSHSLRFKPSGRKDIESAWQSGILTLPGVTGAAEIQAPGTSTETS